MDHRSESHSRTEDWLQNLPASGIRAVCSWEVSAPSPLGDPSPKETVAKPPEGAREPEQRKVAIDARVSISGTQYEVAPELAGEEVVQWWGLFDSELFVEHDEKRFGPYLPVSGPILLDRCRTFKKPRHRPAQAVSSRWRGNSIYHASRWRAGQTSPFSVGPAAYKPSPSPIRTRFSN
jgi:hypothetical protein